MASKSLRNLIEEDGGELKPEVIKRQCFNCRNWRALGLDPVLGHCMRSALALQSHIVTTDMSVCSKHEMAA